MSHLFSESTGKRKRAKGWHMIYKVQRQSSRCLTSPLITLMATSSNPSSTQPHSPSPADDSDGPEAVGAAVWKRRYLALQETVNTEKSSKRKSP